MVSDGGRFSAPTPDVVREGMSIDRASDGLVIEGPGAPNRVWPVTAAFFGLPWLVLVLFGTVWYLGWGVPDGIVARLLLWVVMMAFTVALHALALLSIWSTIYGRTGRETLTIGPERITITPAIESCLDVALSSHGLSGLDFSDDALVESVLQATQAACATIAPLQLVSAEDAVADPLVQTMQRLMHGVAEIRVGRNPRWHVCLLDIVELEPPRTLLKRLQ